MAKDEKRHTTSLYERLAANPELVKLFQHEKEAREAREAVNEVWKKAETGLHSSINRTPVDRTAPKALTNDQSESPLVVAIKNRCGDRPGEAVQWDRFCDGIRDDCHAWVGNPKNRKPGRGYSDRNIKRVYSMLKQRGALNK